MKKIAASNGHNLIRRSGWIDIKYNYHPNRRNKLWYYVTDGNGNREGNKNFDPSSGLTLEYFRWNGRNWAIGQFFSASGTMGFLAPIFFEDDGKTSYIAGYDSENYYNPILIEVDDCCEHVRVYEEE